MRIKINFILLLILAYSQIDASDMQSVIVLDKGVKRYIYMPKVDSNQSKKLIGYNINKLESKRGIIVKFKNSNTSIDDFELKYGLKLKYKMQTGYYIFNNISDKSDVEIIKQIITDETNILTVKPNWEKRNTPR